MTDIFQAEYNESGKINIIIENMAEMIADRRGFENHNYDEILQSFQNNLSERKTFYEKDGVQIAVLISLSRVKNIDKTEDIRYFLYDDFDSYYKFIIIEKATPKAKNQILDLDNVEIVYTEEVAASRKRNIQNPPHILLSPEDQEQIKKEYRIKHNMNLAKILKEDAMARYYNLQIGEIIQIDRSSEGSGIAPFYRICSYL